MVLYNDIITSTLNWGITRDVIKFSAAILEAFRIDVNTTVTLYKFLTNKV